MPPTKTNDRYIDPTNRILDPRTRELEPAEGDMAFAGGQVKAVDVDNRTVTAVVSSGAIDRFEEIIEPSGFEPWLNTFMQNPVMLAGHCHRGFDAAEPTTIGSWQSIEVQDNQVIGTAKFADTPLAQRYWQLYRDGHMRAFSVGVLVHAWEVREFELEQGGNKKIRVLTEVELIEVSAVSVPANRDALVRAASLIAGDAPGDQQPPMERGTSIKQPPDLEQTVEQAIAKHLPPAVKQQLNADPGQPMHVLLSETAEHAAEHALGAVDHGHAAPGSAGSDNAGGKGGHPVLDYLTGGARK